MINNNILGHTLAFVSVFIWSALYVFVKILLNYYNPFELLVLQFIFGYLILLVIKPQKLVLKSKKEEIYFALCGLFGITIYNLFLNLALNYSLASNVSVIIATAPIWTLIFSIIFMKNKIYINFIIGFVISIIGISMLSFQSLNIIIKPFGDFLALLSSIGWGAYAILVVKILDNKYDLLLCTRKIIFYGILFMIPLFYFLDFNPNLYYLTNIEILLNMLFVSAFASGFCFIMWNRATFIIGAIKTNIYVYFTPIITILVSLLVLDEKMSLVASIGTVLTMLGILISQKK